MRITILMTVLLVAGAASGQLVVFDNSQTLEGDDRYDAFKAHLGVWGYQVESRTTPLDQNGDADVIVILPHDAYTDSSEVYTADEAAWLMDFVDAGGGLFVGLAPSLDHQAKVAELMDDFGIATGIGISNPPFYFQFADLPLFDAVLQMGDATQGYCFSLDVTSPSLPVAADEHHDYIAAYTPPGRQTGAAVWVSHYHMCAPQSLYDFDNLRFLANAFEWMTGEPHVVTEDAAWGEVKRLYR